MQVWLASRSHRANMLSPLYKSAGVGVVLTDGETLFVTHNFSCQNSLALATR